MAVLLGWAGGVAAPAMERIGLRLAVLNAGKIYGSTRLG
jgi:hypothetical protein